MDKIPKILIIAGSDSGAGAGIQADLKSAAAQGVYASTAITSVTSQNTLGVQGVFNLPAEVIKSQIESVLSDMSAEYIKTGMLATQEVILAVSEALEKYNIPLVADPVMVAKGGYKLLEDSAIDLLKAKILSKAFLITPNIPEAEILSGIKIHNLEDMRLAGKAISKQISCRYILLKGGHLEDRILTDVVFECSENGEAKIFLEITSEKINTNNTHGTGCSYASTIGALLAKGLNIVDAVKEAHEYIRQGILHSYKIGAGHNPINHFWKN